MDGIRAIAIVAVMGLHTIDRIFSGGFFGVDMFFVLSAFLITSLILEELHTNAGEYRFRDFYWRRALRLGPALILWLALLAWPTAVLVGEASGVSIWTAGSLLYVGNFLAVFGVPDGTAYVHVWSLAVEEQFYLLWPLALVLLWRRSGRAVRAGRWSVVVVMLALAVSVVTNMLLANNYFLPSGHLLPLAAGVMAAFLYFAASKPRLEAFLRLRTPVLFCLIGLAVIICGYAQIRAVGGFLLQLVVALAAGTLILHVCLADHSPITRILSLPVMVWLGRRSYGLYLYHRTLSILLPALFPGLALRYIGPIVLVASLAVAAASFRFVERPVMRMGRARLERRRALAGSQPSSAAPGPV